MALRERVVLIMAVMMAAACSHQGPAPTQASRTAERQPIHLPVRHVSPYEDPTCDPSVGTLTIRLAREEQLPEGPQSFAVLEGGAFVVADPLHERLAFFTNEGKFQRAVCIGWAVAAVELLSNGQLRIKRAGDPTARVIDVNGQPAAGPRAESAAAPPEPVLTSDRSAMLRWSSRAESGSAEPAQTAIELAHPAQRLASVQVIATQRGKAYVRLESTESAARSPTTVGLIVRRYSRTGTLEAEISGISIDYYIVPTTPFRVVNDVLYQLFPTEKEVLIRVWDLP